VRSSRTTQSFNQFVASSDPAALKANSLQPVQSFKAEDADRCGANDMKPTLTGWIGRTVLVQIDRPLYSTHPERPDQKYELNYGYIAGTRSGDEEEIDAYVVGVNVPLKMFRGIVIAVIVYAYEVGRVISSRARGRRRLF
jgi:hypothetical protein